jgi:hypothetical protein
MRRKVKRTLRVRTTETWTITWRSDGTADQPQRRTRRRLRRALPPDKRTKGEGEYDMTTTPTPARENH